MIKYHLIVLSLAVFGLADAQTTDFHISQVYPVDASHSYVGFSIKYMGYAKVKGRFEKFSGAFRYDEQDLNKTSVTFTVNVASIDTDNDWRDEDLRSDNWFNAETFPQIRFISSSVETTDAGFNMIGDLTIKDVTKSVTLEMEPPSGVLKDVRDDLQVIFNGSLTFNRKDFGVEGKNWSKVKEGMTAVGDLVKVELTILGKQIRESNFRNRLRDPERPSGRLYQIVSNGGIAEALDEFAAMRSDDDLKISGATLGHVATMLLKEGNTDQALALFKANLHAFPDQARSHSGYAEALAYAGQLDESARHFNKALALDQTNTYCSEVLRHLGAGN